MSEAEQAMEQMKRRIQMMLRQGLVILALCAIPGVVFAQSVMYMDESGNINFVEKPSQIPAKYRKQLYKEEIQALSQKELNKWTQQQKRTQEKQIKESKKKMALVAKKKERQAQKHKKKKKGKVKKGKKGGVEAPLPEQKGPVVEGGGPELIDE